jgi:cytoskeleton protein RodZ
MTSVGAILQAERERQGRDTAEIAEELCITQRYLRAIEQDDLKSLPGTFFYKSFVKQYAAVLGMDERALHPGMEALASQADPTPLPGGDARYGTGAAASNAHPFSESISNGQSPLRDLDPLVRDANRQYFPQQRLGLSVAALVVVLLACSGFYSWWNKSPAAAASTARVEKPVPPTVTAKAPEPAVQVAAQPPAVVPEAAQAPSVPKLDVTTTTGPDGSKHVVLTLEATEKTWLSISTDGRQIFSGVLEASQTKTLAGVDEARMLVGNAGGIEIRWNGKPIGPIGPRGQVRVVRFTKDDFQIRAPSQTL